MSALPVLSLLVFVPLVGAGIIFLLPPDRDERVRSLATAAAAIPVVLVALMWGAMTAAGSGFRYEVDAPWVPSLGIDYHLGVDGISFPLVALSALVFLVAVVASYGIRDRVKEYFVLLLVLETAVMGVFLALDYILFYIFFELVLIPMYFLIAIWGGPRREYAAIKFLIYTIVGSLLMLVGIIALYFSTGAQTFSIPEIAARAPEMVPPAWRMWIFLALFFGFAVKVPVWPFHTWLPDAHVEAPTPISVVLAAVLLKMGTYGLVRITHPTLPGAARDFAVALAVLGVINIVYGALAAMAQRDMKKLVAYSSVSHMGYVLLGVAAGTAVAVNAAVFQMVAHGIISAMLFLLVGVFYDRTHTREMDRLHGMYLATPTAGVILAFAGLANLGLPLLPGFVAEFFTLQGVFLTGSGFFRTIAYVTVVGVVFTAAFNLLMMHRVLMGRPREEFAVMPDASRRELATLVPLMAACLLLGVWPAVIMGITNAPVTDFVKTLGGM